MLFKYLNFHIQKKLRPLTALLKIVTSASFPGVQPTDYPQWPSARTLRCWLCVWHRWVIQGLVCPGCWLLGSLLASDPSLPPTVCRLFSNFFSQNCTSKEVRVIWGPANPYSLHFSRLHHQRTSSLFQFNQIQVHTSWPWSLILYMQTQAPKQELLHSKGQKVTQKDRSSSGINCFPGS